MGKLQRRNRALATRARRVDPMGVVVLTPAAEAVHGLPGDNSQGEGGPATAVAVGADTSVLPVVRKLCSADATDRAWACAAVSNLLLADAGTLRLLLNNGLLLALVDRLTDSVREVVLEAAGALRNLTVVTGDAVCRELYEKDALTPLLAHAERASAVIDRIVKNVPVDPQNKVEISERSTVFDLMEQAVAVIWALIEVSEKAMKTVTNSQLVTFLLPLLDPAIGNIIPSKLTAVSAQCLAALSDDNHHCHRLFLDNPQYMLVFSKVLAHPVDNCDSDRLLTRIHCASLLTNMRPHLSDAMLGELFSLVIPVADCCLNLDLDACSTEAALLLERIRIQQESKKNEEVCAVGVPSGPDSREEARLAMIESMLTNVQACLEMITNLCSEDFASDVTDSWHDEMEASGEDENDELVDAMMVAGVGEMESSVVQKLDAATNGSFSSRTLPLMLRHATTYRVLPDSAASLVPDRAKEFSAHLARVQARACGALNNTLLNAGTEWFKKWSPEDAAMWWDVIYSATAALAAAQVPVEDRTEAQDGLVGCLWALTRGVNVAGKQIPATTEQIQMLINACSAPDLPPTLRAKGVNLLGILGRTQGRIEDNKLIGTFLISALPTSVPPREDIPPAAEWTCEVLNAVYDVYADENFDYDSPVFVACGFIRRLRQAAPVVRDIARGVDRRIHRDLRQRVDEAYRNLSAFVAYKAANSL